MSKRLIDSEDFNNEAWRKLEPEYKALYLHLFVTAHPSGIFPLDFDRIQFDANVDVDPAKFWDAFRGKVYNLDGKVGFIPAVPLTQYGKLTPGCRPHDAVIKRLKEHGLIGENGEILRPQT